MLNCTKKPVNQESPNFSLPNTYYRQIRQKLTQTKICAIRYAKIYILMVSSILYITSQVEHTKECNSIDSESKSVKRNTDHQNHLTVCFYMLL